MAGNRMEDHMLKQLLATTALTVALAGTTWAQTETTEPLVDESAPAAEAAPDSGEAPLVEDDAATAAEEAPIVEEGDTTTAEEAAPVEEEATTTAEEVAPVEEEATTAEEAPMVEEGDTTTAQEVEPALEGATDADTMAADPADTVVDPAATMEAQLVPVDIAELTVEELTGASLRNVDGETLGTIDDALLDDGGNIESLVVSFGGFLGFGKKTVEVALDEVELMKDEGGSVVARTTMTPESLEQRPDYEEPPEA
jgi:sporulation protein YlmC with PRC-barrel domain